MKKNRRLFLSGLLLALLATLMSACSATTDANQTPMSTNGSTETGASPSPTRTVEPSESTEVEPSSEVESLACDLPLPVSSDWPVVLCETFDNNRNNWIIESQDNPFSNYAIDIQDGKYALSYTAKAFAGFQRAALTWFDVPPAKDFSISVSGRIDSFFQNTSWGVAFRAAENSFFLFSIDNNNTYAFEIYEGKKWIPLISRRPYTGIKPGEDNKLGVFAEGGDFTLFINDVEVNRFSGGQLEDDGILLVVSASEGSNAQFFFDDIVLQTQP